MFEINSRSKIHHFEAEPNMAEIELFMAAAAGCWCSPLAHSMLLLIMMRAVIDAFEKQVTN